MIEWQVAGEKTRGSLSIELDEVVAAGSIIEREYALVGTSGAATLVARVALRWQRRDRRGIANRRRYRI